MCGGVLHAIQVDRCLLSGTRGASVAYINHAGNAPTGIVALTPELSLETTEQDPSVGSFLAIAVLTLH
jgi:hypothetical protein